MSPVPPPRPPSGPGASASDESRREADRDGRGKRTAFEFDAFAVPSESDAAREKRTMFGMTANEFGLQHAGVSGSVPPSGGTAVQVAVNRVQGIGQHPPATPPPPSSLPSRAEDPRAKAAPRSFVSSAEPLNVTAPHGFSAPLAPPPPMPSYPASSARFEAPAHGGHHPPPAAPVHVAPQVRVAPPVHVSPPSSHAAPPQHAAPYAHVAPHSLPPPVYEKTPRTVHAAPAYVPEAPAAPRAHDYAGHAGGFQPVLTPPPARQPPTVNPRNDAAVLDPARYRADPAGPSAPLPTTQPALAQVTSHARPTAVMDVHHLHQVSVELPEFGSHLDSSSRRAVQAPEQRSAHDRGGDSSSGWPTPADGSDSSSRWRVSRDPDLDDAGDSDGSASRWAAGKGLSVGRKPAPSKLLIGACAVAVTLCGGALYIKSTRTAPELVAAQVSNVRSRDEDPRAPARSRDEDPRPGAQREQTGPAADRAEGAAEPVARRQLAAPEAVAREPDVAAEPPPRDQAPLPSGREVERSGVGSPAPETASDRRRAARHERRHHESRHEARAEEDAEEEVAAAPPPQPEPARPAEPAAAQGGVTERSAATLYINGKYKEAHAEYLLLAQAHPKQRVYAELARILRRRLIETCVRTQPHRREQCREL